MILKKRDQSLIVRQLKALQRRIPLNHSMQQHILSDLKKWQSGIRGEKELDHPLSFLNAQDYLILHDLRLRDEQGFFQIDTLLITEWYILLLEVKNWYGAIVFGENGQVSRIGDSGKEEGFPNPIPQVKLQKHRLTRWLVKHGLEKVPIPFFIVISFPTTIIKSGITDGSIPKNVIHNSQLLFHILKLKDIYQTPIISMSMLRKIANLLASTHQPAKENVLKKYNIKMTELMPGVFCPRCGVRSMSRKKQKWYCTSCGYFSIDAHLEALNDYKLLISDCISNREARVLLSLHSPDIVKRLLQKAKFAYTGRTKNRIYKLIFSQNAE